MSALTLRDGAMLTGLVRGNPIAIKCAQSVIGRCAPAGGGRGKRNHGRLAAGVGALTASHHRC